MTNAHVMNPISANALKSVSVLDFGASGDGKADDTQAIQAALASALWQFPSADIL
ncbi:hypothetical protein FACS1894141_2090 [Spirochaetia bacterium]|nr:hypothetical protein FACS1894141_2090 [Spirochaetia bacterium]